MRHGEAVSSMCTTWKGLVLSWDIAQASFDNSALTVVSVFQLAHRRSGVTVVRYILPTLIAWAIPKTEKGNFCIVPDLEQCVISKFNIFLQFFPNFVLTAK